MLTKHMILSVFCAVFLAYKAMPAMQHGTLVLTNSSGSYSALRIESDLVGTGEIVGKKFLMPDSASNNWAPFAPGKPLHIETGITLGGKPNAWGSLVKLYILNMKANKTYTFLLSKISEYTLAKDEQNNLLLVGKEGNIYAQ